jgi:hypothetical protein
LIFSETWLFVVCLVKWLSCTCRALLYGHVTYIVTCYLLYIQYLKNIFTKISNLKKKYLVFFNYDVIIQKKFWIYFQQETLTEPSSQHWYLSILYNLHGASPLFDLEQHPKFLFFFSWIWLVVESILENPKSWLVEISSNDVSTWRVHESSFGSKFPAFLENCSGE